MEIIETISPSVLIIPDASSNDGKYLTELCDKGIKIVVLDHHLAEEGTVGPNIAVIINNQMSDYPNKDFSGAGIVYQFLRYCEDKLGIDPRYSDDLLDLVASGNLGDVMSLTSLETKHLINKGFEPDNIHNPFIYYMWQKNQFKLGDHITPMGAAFYIVPFVNATVRSGTQEEKELVFESMLSFKAFKEIPSTKRGHKIGEKETLVEQAVRTTTNIKTRQGKAVDAAMEKLEGYIKSEDMLARHKVLMFLLKPGVVDKNVAGLVCNKLMSKYQRPVAILTMNVATLTEGDGEYYDQVTYSGSARGCSDLGVTNFKEICEQTGLVEYTVGHESAFGISIKQENVKAFLERTDEVLKDMSSEPIYFVDYILRGNEIPPNLILEIAELKSLWGQNMPESLIAISHLQITKDQLVMMKSNTMKITLPGGIACIKFQTPDEEFNKLYSETGYVEVNLIGKPERNEWMGRVYPQLIIQDMEIVGSCAYVF